MDLLYDKFGKFFWEKLRVWGGHFSAKNWIAGLIISVLTPEQSGCLNGSAQVRYDDRELNESVLSEITAKYESNSEFLPLGCDRHRSLFDALAKIAPESFRTTFRQIKKEENALTISWWTFYENLCLFCPRESIGVIQKKTMCAQEILCAQTKWKTSKVY